MGNDNCQTRRACERGVACNGSMSRLLLRHFEALFGALCKRGLYFISSAAKDGTRDSLLRDAENVLLLGFL